MRTSNPFKSGIDYMINMTGIDCYGDLNGVPTEFRGIYDEQARTEIDGGQEVLVNETGLLVKRSVGNKLAINQAIRLYVEAEEDPLWYRIRDKRPIEDGSLVQLFLVLRTDTTQPDPYNELEDEWENC